MQNKRIITSINCKLCLRKCSNHNDNFSKYEEYAKGLGVTGDTKFCMKICNECVKSLIRLTCFRKRILLTAQQWNIEGLKCNLCQIQCNEMDSDVEGYHEILNKYFKGLDMTLNGKICVDCIEELETTANIIPMWKNTIEMLSHDVTLVEVEMEEEPMPPVPDVFICEICGRSDFKSKSHLRNHKYNKHTSQGSYLCDICPKSHVFKSKVYLKRHMALHLTTKTITCNLCNIPIKSAQLLHYHRRKFHTEPKDYKHECPYCGRRIFKKFELNNHIDTHTGIKRFFCDICDAAFSSRRVLKHHVTTVHIDTKNFVCTECGKKFKCEQYLKGHLRSHEKNYCCPRCKKRFSYPVALRQHVQLHHKDFIMPPPATQLKNFDWSTYQC